MAFNRLADRRLDALNPRTQMRHLPAGVLSTGSVVLFTIACSLGFVAGTLLFLPRNPIPLYASLPVLAFLFGYSYAKRFTALSHFWLGAALMLAPLAAWVAIRAELAWRAGGARRGGDALGGGLRHDLRLPGLRVRREDAAPQRARPIRRGRRLAAGGRCATWARWRCCLLLPLVYDGFGAIYLSGVAAIAMLLIYEHWLVRPDDLSRVNRAFFHVNAVVSIGLLAVGVVDLLV